MHISCNGLIVVQSIKIKFLDALIWRTYINSLLNSNRANFN